MDVFADMCTAVERDDANIVNHLVENRHISRRLEDLNIIVVSARMDWGTRIEAQDTPLGQPSILGAVCAAPPARSLAPFRRIRNASIRRIHNQRRALAWNHLGSSVKPVTVVGLL